MASRAGTQRSAYTTSSTTPDKLTATVTVDVRRGITCLAVQSYVASGLVALPDPPLPPPTTWPKVGHVRLHPVHHKAWKDKCDMFPCDLPPQVLTHDPATFQPDRTRDHPRPYYVSRWGLGRPPKYVEGCPEVPEITWQYIPDDAGSKYIDAIREKNEKLEINGEMDALYYPYQTPTQQFIAVLEKRKLSALKEPSLKALIKVRLLRLNVLLVLPTYNGTRQMVRDVVVPASMTLAKLHDEVLCPVLGWSRGYHGYCFEAIEDGSTFGPARYAGACDMIHVTKHYHHMTDDRTVPVALLLRNEGDACLYTYDLGECWQFQLTVQHTIDMSEEAMRSSQGMVSLTGGELACPPEDMSGLKAAVGGYGGPGGYGIFLSRYEADPDKFKTAIQTVSTQALNYARPYMSPETSRRFDPFEFDHAYHEAYLKASLKDVTLWEFDAKQKADMAAAWDAEGNPNPNPDPGGDTAPAVAADPDASGSTTSQTATKKKKKKKKTKEDKPSRVCHTCNNASTALKACAACQRVWYCSVACQKKDWRQHKVECQPNPT
eukprot:m.23070 g.23070  ORF g.23070 m.23070 type:complete len:547 (-) comp4051_c0_seq1:219-1859(-)